jgi:hypothetical protein
MARLEQVEIFIFHMPRHSTFVQHKLQHNNRNYMTAVKHQVIGFMCSFVYGMVLQPVGIKQLGTFYFFMCDLQTSSPR